VFRTPGVAMVQSITRPLGTPLDHTSLGFAMSAQSSAQVQNLPFQQARADDLLKQVDEISKSIEILHQQYALTDQQYTLQQQATAATDEQVTAFRETSETIKELRDKVANFDDFFRATTSIGSRTASTSRCVRRSARCSTLSTAWMR
jgi:RND superfamily putative drug exporter